MSEILKNISTALSLSPFNKSISSIQLDSLSVPELLDILYLVTRQIDSTLQDEATVKDLLILLNYDKLLDLTNNNSILDSLNFLLTNLPTHKTRFYLSKYLVTPSIPIDYSQDEVIIHLQHEISQAQERFKQIHQDLTTSKLNNTHNVKNEITLMKEERYQVMAKIEKLKTRVGKVPKVEGLLKVARELRIEQGNEVMLKERVVEEEKMLKEMRGKYESVKSTLKTIKEQLASTTPEAVFHKLEEESRMNAFFANVNLPKSIHDAKTKLNDLKQIVEKDIISDVEMANIEKEIVELGRINTALLEKSLNTKIGDANLALFRQQASIIAAKKDGMVQKLSAVTEEMHQLESQVESVRKPSSKMLTGDDLKKYVSDLRAKSVQFKRQKMELDSLTTEQGVLSRTKQILQAQEQELLEKLRQVEKQHGIVGYNDARETLEKVSALKSEKDQEKGQALQEISEIIQNLVNSINEKKATLAPVIQRLRSLRQEHQDLQSQYDENRRIYDATMFGIDSEISRLDNEIKAAHIAIDKHQTQYHYINQLIQQCEIDNERGLIWFDVVMNEVKAYVGTDENIQLIQKARGFKSYRDLYNKKIMEGQAANRELLLERDEIKSKYEPNMKQLEMFKGVKRLLELKFVQNEQILKGVKKEENQTQDLLVKDRYNQEKSLIRMSWHRDNLKNLLNAKLPDLQRLTVYQQKWTAKKYLRGYHVPNINEKQFLDRHFKTNLPIKIHSKADREKLPPIQSIMFGNLERRVDVVVFRSLFASSIWNARQMTVHGHVKVNGEVCRYPARELNDGDMITVSPIAISMLDGTKFTPFPYMAPWMFIPTYLEVSFATCSSVFLRSPLVQPSLMEIPSPYPPNWHQLVYEWYAQKKKAQVKEPLKQQLIINGKAVKLKPKFDRMIRRDQYLARESLKTEKALKVKAEAAAERRKFKANEV